MQRECSSVDVVTIGPCSGRGKLYPHYCQYLNETSRVVTLPHVPSSNLSDSCEADHTKPGYSASSPERIILCVHVCVRACGASLADVVPGKNCRRMNLPSCRVRGARSLKVYGHDSSTGEGPTSPWECRFTFTDLPAMASLRKRKPHIVYSWQSYLHEAESFRSHQLLSYSIISHFMEPEGSLTFDKSPPLFPALKQINLVHITPFYFSKIRFNIILPPTLDFCRGLLTEYSSNCAHSADRVNCGITP
jgi:hypothetical protein